MQAPIDETQPQSELLAIAYTYLFAYRSGTWKAVISLPESRQVPEVVAFQNRLYAVSRGNLYQQSGEH